MNTQSFSYKLAEAAFALSQIKSVAFAKDFLIHNMNRYEFKNWEQAATMEAFRSLRKEGKWGDNNSMASDVVEDLRQINDYCSKNPDSGITS